jgi:hypothetical protein
VTRATAIARAEQFAEKAAALFFEAETARRARCHSDAAELETRAHRATRNAAAYRAHAA